MRFSLRLQSFVTPLVRLHKKMICPGLKTGTVCRPIISWVQPRDLIESNVLENLWIFNPCFSSPWSGLRAGEREGLYQDGQSLLETTEKRNVLPCWIFQFTMSIFPDWNAFCGL